jgi:uncharacterized protein DUF4236
MGFRFRKSVKLAPGLKLNFSKNGVSTSIGGHGLTTNISRRGVRETVGLRGTGLSYSTRLGGHHAHGRRTHHTHHVASTLFLAGVLFWAFGSTGGGLLLIMAGLILAIL